MATTVLDADQKKGLLRVFKVWAKTRYQSSLYAALHQILIDPAISVTRGVIRVSAGSGEVSASYSTNVGINQADFLGIVSKMIDDYEAAKQALIDDGVEDPDDDQIYERELSGIRAVKGYTTNFMYITK